ncbi:sterile alpha motif domain-containing protein 3-like [Ornithodoros turicata]|uniref:sterile alpha motif domain-containing protein 3-like n=1 Tax=Ornithodoros turicata TaxID=34597 RepID=UPI003138AF4C
MLQIVFVVLSTQQVFDEVFQRRVDLANDDVIADKTEVFVLTAERPVPSQTEGSLCASSVAQSCTDNHANSRDGRDFDMPDFSSIQEQIEDGKLTGSLHRKIVERLYQSMIRCTLYPSAKFYAKVASSLVEKYQHLTDLKGSGYDSWIISLRNKFKNERRKISDNESVTESRSKFGTKRKIEKASESRLERNKTPRLPDGGPSSQTTNAEEDEAWLRNEYRKQKPDFAEIRERQKSTFRERSKRMKSTVISVCQKEFPYVMDFKAFMLEFELLTDKDAVQGVQAAMYTVIELAGKKEMYSKQEIQAGIADLPKLTVCARRKRHMSAVLALRTLCEVFKEKEAMDSIFVHQSRESRPGTPHISYSGTSLEDAEILKLVVDSTPLFHVVEAMDGLAAVLAAYWVFDAVYCAEHIRVMTFFERMVGLQVTPLQPPVSSFIKKHKRSLP